MAKIANSDAVNPTEGFFHDGLSIIAADISTITARITNNAMLNNFEKGLTLRTLNSGTINATLDGNRFANDIGFDNTPSPPGPFGGLIDDFGLPGTWVIRANVPAPGAICLLGLAGLAGRRRRG